MGEVTEKIYCYDKGDNDNALAATILAGNNRKDDWSPIAAIYHKVTKGIHSKSVAIISQN